MFKQQQFITNNYIIIALATLVSIILLWGNLYVGAVVAGILLSITVFLNMEAVYWIILINVYVISSLVAVHFPSIGKKIIWITDLMLFILSARIFLDIMLKRIKIFKYKVNIMLFLLISLGMISAIVNRASATVLFCGLRNYFKYIPIFLASVYYFDNENLIRKSFLFWIIIGLINVPIAFIQFFVYHNFDAVGGLFSLGSSGILTVYQLFTIGYLLILAKNNILKKWKAILLSTILFTPIFINQTKIVFFLLPVLFVYIYQDFIIKKPVKTMCIFVLALVLFGSLAMIYTKLIHGFSLNDIFSRDWLYKYLYTDPYYCREGGLNRLSAVTFALDKISRNPLHFLIGTGIGNASLSNIPGGMGEYYKEYFGLGIDIVYLSRILWEYGIIGTSLYFLIIFRLWRYSDAERRASKNIYIKSVSQVFGLLTLFLFINIIYDRSFHYDQFACIFWLLGGFFTKLRQI